MVAGEGLAGLECGLELERRRLTVRVLERAERAGGRVRPCDRDYARLKQLGFSHRMIERFFRPLLGGMFLDSGSDDSGERRREVRPQLREWFGAEVDGRHHVRELRIPRPLPAPPPHPSGGHPGPELEDPTVNVYRGHSHPSAAV